MTAEQIMAAPTLSCYIGSVLEPAARLIADAAAGTDEERNRRDSVPDLAGILAAEIGGQHIKSILIVLEAAWLAGYRVGLVDGMITAPAESDGQL